MILEFSIENFLSFNHKVSFSMLANGTQGLENNYLNVLNYKVLKTAAIFGPNASGKTNLFKALNTVSYLIRNSITMDINAPLQITPCIYSKSKYSSFEIKFIKDKIKYVYGFKANKNIINEEYLYYYPNGREALIFDRTNSNNYQFPKKDSKLLSEIKDKTTNNKFFLSSATTWNYPVTKAAYDFLTIDLNICFNLEQLVSLAMTNYYNNPSLKNTALTFLKEADFNIIDYDIKTVDLPLEILNTLPEDIKKIMKNYQITFTHKLKDNTYELSFQEESMGTQLMFSLIPFIAIALEKGQVLIIDELDKSLHPLLLEYIVELFNNPSFNRAGAQLIFNTHDTNLLDLNLLRRDQIWFIDKNDNLEASSLYSLSDFGVKNHENIEKGYLLGRYSAVPYIKSNINL